MFPLIVDIWRESPYCGYTEGVGHVPLYCGYIQREWVMFPLIVDIWRESPYCGYTEGMGHVPPIVDIQREWVMFPSIVDILRERVMFPLLWIYS